VIKAFPDAFENTEWSKKTCGHFKPTEKYSTHLQTEIRKAEWEKASEFMPIYRCSVCGERNLFKNGNNVFSNYCPQCGARMKGEQ
jgi:DNA-directed RNA polymerase subunit RPC12/RpoP